jgi:hypothetical protein
MLLACALALTATFFSFLLVTDDVVLFTCVFTLALIGLTGTVNVNQELIVCFLVFLTGRSSCWSTRTICRTSPEPERRGRRTAGGAPGAAASSASPPPAPAAALSLRLLRTQVVLGLACGLTAVVIGFLIAIPVQMLGRNMSLASVIRRMAVPAAADVVRPSGRGVGLIFDDPRTFQVGLGR